MECHAPETDRPWVVRSLTAPEVHWSAELHRRALPGGFFVRLGTLFLRRYHLAFVESPHGVALVIESHGTPCGFVLGTIDRTAHYRHVLGRWWPSLGAVALVGLIRRPGLAVTFVRRRARRYAASAWRLRRRTPTPTTAAGPPSANLAHIAVTAEARGLGSGAALARAFVEHADRSGVTRVTSQTATADAFYERLGWRQVADVADFDGQRHRIFVHER